MCFKCARMREYPHGFEKQLQLPVLAISWCRLYIKYLIIKDLLMKNNLVSSIKHTFRFPILFILIIIIILIINVIVIVVIVIVTIITIIIIISIIIL